jgi:hypothetical protein
MTKNKTFFVDQLMQLRGDDSEETRNQLITWKILDLMIAIRTARRAHVDSPPPPPPTPDLPATELPIEDDDCTDSFLYRAGARF